MPRRKNRQDYEFVVGFSHAIPPAVSFHGEIKTRDTDGLARRTRRVSVVVPLHEILRIAALLNAVPGDQWHHALYHYESPRSPYPCSSCPDELRTTHPAGALLPGKESE